MELLKVRRRRAISNGHPVYLEKKNWKKTPKRKKQFDSLAGREQ